MYLQDHQNENPGGNPAEVADRRFEEDYLRPLGKGARFVRLESASKLKFPGNADAPGAEMHKRAGCCKALIEKTAGALNDDVVTLMLLAVQTSNLELSVKMAVNR